MRFFIHTLIFSLLITQICFTQWFWQNPIPTGDSLNGLYFNSSDTGWGVGNYGTIVKTTNGGLSWSIVESGISENLNEVTFFENTTGIIVGGMGKILRTTDSGLTWYIVQSGTSFDLLDISIINSACAVAVGNSGTIIRTTDKGITWNSQISGTTLNDLKSVSFKDENNGLITGGVRLEYPHIQLGMILRTSDSGITWDTVFYSVEFYFQAVDYSDPDNAIAIGMGRYARSTNGGLTWTGYFNGGQLYDISFCGQTGIAVGVSGSIRKTTDIGLTWTELNSGIGENLYSICSIDSNNFFISGDKGRILQSSDEGQTWIPYSSMKGGYSVSFLNQDCGIIVGKSGLIYRTTDGGMNWINQSSGTDKTLLDVAFKDPNNGVVVGASGTIISTTNGGETWVARESGTTNILYSAAFSDTNIVTVVGWGGIMLKSTDGGINWFPQSSGTDLTLNQIFFMDKLNAIAAGGGNGYGIILRTTDGGLIWTSRLFPTSAPFKYFLDISFNDEYTGTIVGFGGIILRTTDGGINWAEQQSGTTLGLKSVSFTDANNGTIVGELGTILRTTDGGTNWIRQYFTSINIEGVCFLDHNKGFAIGDQFIIETFNGGGIPVQLVSFTAAVQGKTLNLKWITSTETNNYGFHVERRFSDRYWENRGFIPGAGTSTEIREYSFSDELYLPGKYSYRLKQINFDGSFDYSNTIYLEYNSIADKFSLDQNYPNPFNPNTTIKYSVPHSSNVTLKIFDILGSEIEKLVNEEKPAGTYELTWNAASLPSGVYFYQLKAGSFVSTKKMILMK